MDIIFKIIAIGLISCVAAMIVRPVRSDFSIIIGIAGGLIIIAMIINYFTGIISTLKDIIGITGLNSSIYTILLKIIAIGYLIDFSAGICSETGNSWLGDKIILGGKVVIMVMALPIITNILNIIMELLPKWKKSIK